jgi:hypothetical protein
MRSVQGGVDGSWNQTTLPLHERDTLQRDPSVDWTSDGTAWAMIIGISRSTGIDTSAVKCYKSTDDGATWQYEETISGTQLKPDKPMMWVNHMYYQSSYPDDETPGRPNYVDYVYAIWHNYPTGMPDDTSGVFVNYRTPGPSGAWQSPVKVSGAETTGQGHGCDIKTDIDGFVYAFWHDTGSKNLYVTRPYDSHNPPFTSIIATTIASNEITIPSSLSAKPVIYITAVGGVVL